MRWPVEKPKPHVLWAVKEYKKFMLDRPNETPSIDRINSDGHYELSNMRIISWSENSQRSFPVQFMKTLDSSLSKEEFLTRMCNLIIKICNRRKVSIAQFIETMKEYNNDA